MEKFTNLIEEKMVPAVSKVTSMRYFSALRSGFLAVMPLTIIASIFLLITSFPVEGYPEFMASIFGEDWVSYISPAYKATFDMMGFMLCGTLAYKLSEDYELDKLSVMILALVSYIIITPKIAIAPESREIVSGVLPMAWLGSKGILAAIFMGITSTEIFRFVVRKKMVIKLPDSVPPMVSRSFSALIPGVLIIAFSLLVNGLALAAETSLHEWIYEMLQVPLQGLTASIGAITIVGLLNGLLWWFGIHPGVVNSVVNPMITANTLENQKLFEAGNLTLQNGHIGTIQMIDQFATIGGAGMTIGLIISVLLVARSQRLKMLGKLSAVPALFNINEPLVFGLPIIFNPLMLIPVALAPTVSILIAYFAQKIGFMPLFNGIQAPWPTPGIFSGFLVAGWQGAAVQIVCILVSTMIYYPFVKALDNQYRKEELVEEQNNL